MLIRNLSAEIELLRGSGYLLKGGDTNGQARMRGPQSRRWRLIDRVLPNPHA
ncbi:hypothetical protein [Paenibacillus sp. FSL W7-1332]|uniref:hypothetical protein n=1 Tax=Paenibacillus sp. FSL W7-1332 TaxID=2921702 RepID=UPI0030CE4457